MILGIIHFMYFMFVLLYPFSLKHSIVGDKIFFSVIIFVMMNWYLLNGECILSYLYKISKNPNYKIGSDTKDLTDISTLFKIKNFDHISQIGIVFIEFYLLISFFYLNNRSKLLSFNQLLFFSFFLIYSSVISKHYYNDIIKKYNMKNVVKYTGIGYLIYITIKIWNK